jgi:hypothetical protein
VAYYNNGLVRFMKKNYSETTKKVFLNNRLNEYCLFLRGVNAGIALNNSEVKNLSDKLTALSLCKAIGVNYSLKYSKYKPNTEKDIEFI